MKKIIKRLFLAEILAQSVLIYSISSIMFSERGGLSPGQIGIILASFSITTLLFEIPTGAIADLFSRKLSMVIARVLLSLGMIMWLISPSFGGYLAGMVLIGLSESLMSGALQAYLYESLGEDSHKFAKYNARLWSAMMVGFMIGAGGAFIIGQRYNILLILSALLPLLSALVSYSLPKDTIEKDETSKFVHQIKGAINYIIKSKSLIYTFLSILSMKVLVDVLIEYLPLYYKAAGSPTRIVALLFLFGNLLTIFLFWHTEKITNFLRKKEILYGTLFLIILLVSRYLGAVPAIAGVFIYVRYVRISFVNLESEFQHKAINKYRATLGSLYSMGSRLGAAVSLILVGAFAKESVIAPILVFTIVWYLIHLVSRMQGKRADELDVQGIGLK